MKFKWLLLILLLGLAAYFFYSSKIESVWHNLGDISQSGEIPNIEVLLDKLSKHPPDSLVAELKSDRQSWPISLLKDHFVDTADGQINIDETYIKSILADTTGFQFKLLKMMFTDRLSDTLSRQEKEFIIRNITSGKLTLDSAYSLYIEEWVGTDSIAVQFLKDR